MAAHIAGAAGRAIAVEVVIRIRDRCALISHTPGEIGTHRPEIREGIRSHPIPPHVVSFRYQGATEAQVVRILHERQDVDRNLIG